MFTFKQQITVPDELLEGFALFLKYQPTLTRRIKIEEEDKPMTFIDEEYPNPETPEQYVDRLAKEHSAEFIIPFGEQLIQDELAKLGIDAQKEQAELQLKEAIMKPVLDSLTSEVVKSK